MISYDGLRKIKRRHRITNKMINEATGISNNTLAKIDTDGNMFIESIAKIAKYVSEYSGRDYDIGDLVSTNTQE